MKHNLENSRIPCVIEFIPKRFLQQEHIHDTVSNCNEIRDITTVIKASIK